MPVSNFSKSLKRVLPSQIWRPMRAIGTGLLTPFRFALRTGHWKSSIGSAAKTRRGEPIPWYTYSAIDFLSQRDFSAKHVLEFGGGQSTLWWSRRAADVLTVEEDKAWYESLRSKIGANVELHHVAVDQQTRTIEPIRAMLNGGAARKFDVIIVDGHLRREVAAMAFEYLAPRGALILDNAEGYGFFDETKARDCRRIDFFGFAPGVSRRHCTSLIFIEDCFLLDPSIPIADIEDA